MPKVLNKFGVVTVVSDVRAQEMIRDDGATLLNEPDMLPNDPVDSRSARQPNPRRTSPPTEAEKQVIAAQKEEIRAQDIAEREARAAANTEPKEPQELSATEAITDSVTFEAATPEEAMGQAVEVTKKRGRPKKV